MAIPLLECVHLRKSTEVPFLSRETGGEKCLYELASQRRTYDARAENEDVHIVVFDALVC